MMVTVMVTVMIGVDGAFVVSLLNEIFSHVGK